MINLKIKITIIYPVEPSYILGLLNGLSKFHQLDIDFLGSDRSSVIQNKYNNVKFINIRGSQDPNRSLIVKIFNITKFYLKLLIYCFKTDSKIFHSHFPNKFLFLDFVLINLILKLRGIKLVYTAHNIDFGLRDRKQSFYKTLLFNFHYKITDLIIVHNKYSSRILIEKYPFTKSKFFIERIGLNKSVIKSGLSQVESRKNLNIDSSKKVLLFFGGLNPYKGLELLIEALANLTRKDKNFLLIIAGSPRDMEYHEKIEKLIKEFNLDDFIRKYYKFIPDSEVENYFMASDCCILPYKFIFQSGVHVLSYSFGVPIICSDVGSFKEEDVIEQLTGFTFKSEDSADLESVILRFFDSNLYTNKEFNRIKIIEWAEKVYSWDTISESTLYLYKKILKV